MGMDYHLDWIHTSLFLTLPGNGQQAIHPNTGPVATGNQEDVDLIVGFDDGHVTQLLLIEAKGETSWTNKQTLSKANRLRDIFGLDGTKYERVSPHFVLMSPRPPRQLKSHLWPSWMTQGGEPIWIELAVPTGRRKVMRCDSEGRPWAAGGFLKVSLSPSPQAPGQRRVAMGR